MTAQAAEKLPDLTHPTKTGRRPGKPRADQIIPDSTIIHLRTREKLSESEIATRLNVTIQTVNQRCKRLGLDALNHYKDSRADILALQQQRLMSAITDADIKKAGLRDKVIAAGILYDKERLERGQSTANVAYQDMTKVIGDIDREIAELEAKLGVAECQSGDEGGGNETEFNNNRAESGNIQ